MTTGSLRTEPTVGCVLAPPAGGGATTPGSCLLPGGVQLPGLYTGMADQVTPLPVPPFQAVSSALLPTSQQAAVLGGMSGLLQPEQQLGDRLAPDVCQRVRQPDTARDDESAVGDRRQLHRPDNLRFVQPYRRQTGRDSRRLGPDAASGAIVCRTRPIPYRLPISGGPRRGRELLPGFRQ